MKQKLSNWKTNHEFHPNPRKLQNLYLQRLQTMPNLNFSLGTEERNEKQESGDKRGRYQQNPCAPSSGDFTCYTLRLSTKVVPSPDIFPAKLWVDLEEKDCYN